MMVILLIIAAVLGLAVLYNMWLFDLLVEWEFEHHREQWERDGKPTGFLCWCPKEGKVFSDSGAAQHLNFIWLFRTPDWATESSECRRWLAYKRVTTLVASLVVLVLLLKLL
jgi:hypothetical protein